MAFSYTLIKTDALDQGATRTYLGYDLLGGAGMVLNVRLNFAIPGAAPPPMKGLEKELYLPGDSVATLNPVWTQLNDENLGNGVRRYEHAYQTPGGNILLRALTRATIRVDRTDRVFYVDEQYTVLEDTTLNVTDLQKSVRQASVSLIDATTYTGAAVPAWENVLVEPAGAPLQRSLTAETGDDLLVNLVFSVYNNSGFGFDAHIRVLLDATEVCWNRVHFATATGRDTNCSMSGWAFNLAAGARTLTTQIYVATTGVQVTQHYGAARGKLEYRLFRR